jgi:hypothetical protein
MNRNEIYGHEVVLQPVELKDTVNIPGKTWTKYVYEWAINADSVTIDLATFSKQIVIGRLYQGVIQPSNYDYDVFKMSGEANPEDFPCNLLSGVDAIGPKVTASPGGTGKSFSAKTAPMKQDKFSEYSLRQTALNDAVKLVAALIEKTKFNTKGDLMLGKDKIDTFELIRQYYKTFHNALLDGEFSG